MAQTLPYQNSVNNVSWIEQQNSRSATASSSKVASSSSSGAVSSSTAGHTLNITVDPMQINCDPSSATTATAASIFVELSPPSTTKSSKLSSITDSPIISSSKLDDLGLNRSSFHSSGGLRTPDTDLKWTSFNDDSEAEDTPGSRRHSESEHKNLLDDDPLLSDGDDSQASNFDPNEECTDEKSFEISPELRSYYVDKYKKLLIQQTYSGVDGATPTTAIVDLRSSALKGSSPAVQEFFRKSQLNQSDLSKIWYLADVNMDGYLNLDEFLVAMHLIVRRVKGNYNIPSQLPVEFRPPVTPPRNSANFETAMVPPATSEDGPTSARQWAEFADTPQPPKAPSPATSSGAGLTIDPLSPQILAKFTSIPPSDQNAKMAYPKARRGSPDFGNGRPSTGAKSPFGSVSVSSTQFSNAAPIPPLPRPRPSTSSESAKVKSPPPMTPPTKVLSPLTPNPPKGPPPKPPPRPPRHTRSVSLDLNKNRLSELTSPPLASTLPPAPSVEPATLNPFLVDLPPRRDAQVQTIVPFPVTDPTAPMLDLSLDLNRTLISAAAATDGPTNGAKSITSSSAADPTEDHSKDWKKRCARLNRVNDDLERELRKLQQIRADLEFELKRMQKF